MEAEMRETCEKCGGKPTRMITSRKHLGMIIYGKTWQSRRLLCREHARQLLVTDLVFTAILGWWGVFSFFVNIGVVIGQIAALSALSQLAATPAQPVPEAAARKEAG
jgi:hypothetical protein